MKTRYWANEVMLQTGFTQPKEFIEACREGTTALAAVGGVAWETYFSGQRAPVNKTVYLVESVVPGSASWFFDGVEGMPLWSILAGDIQASKALFYEVVDALYAEPEWDFQQRAIALAVRFMPLDFTTRIERPPEGFPVDLRELPACPRRCQTWFERFIGTPKGFTCFKDAYVERGGFPVREICAVLALHNLARAYDNRYVAALSSRLTHMLVTDAIREEFEGVGDQLCSYVPEFLRR